MKCKEVRFVEGLLKNYKAMKAEIYNLNVSLSMIERQKNGAIESEFIKASCVNEIPGLPKGGYIDNMPLIPKGRELEMLNEEQRFIIMKLHDIEDVISMLDSSLNSVSLSDKQIVLDFYVERLSLQQIADKVHMAPENVSRKKDKILLYMYKSLCTLLRQSVYMGEGAAALG